MKKLPIILLAGAACLVNHVTAQTQKILADKIVARVGDKIVLQSDIEPPMELEIKTAITPDCYMLATQLMQKSLAIEAIKDSILKDDVLDGMLDSYIEGLIVQYGGRKQLEDAAHKSIYEIKQGVRPQLTERNLADAMRSKIIAGIKISPTEVKNFFEKIPSDSLLYYDATYEINELVIYPNANKDVEDYATTQLLGWKQQVETGPQKFEALANIYSQDKNTMYNVNKNDKQWDPTWFAAIWKLKEGQVSPVIKSKFGLHIIQMVSRAGDDAVVRHILLTPQATAGELMQSTTLLDSVRTQVLAGHISFAAAINKFSQDEGSRNNAGRTTAPDGSTDVTIDGLGKDVAAVAKTMQPGNISKPLVYKDDRGRTAVKLIYMAAKTDAHMENLQTDYTKIAARALEQKKNAALLQWIKQHIQDFSVSVDKSLADCENVKGLMQN